MKKNRLIQFVLTMCLLSIIYIGTTSSGSGANGYTTSGCSCHGAQSNLTTLSLIGIPTAGYIAGTTYTLTATVTNTGKVEAGFNIGCNNGAFTQGTNQQTSGVSDLSHTTPTAMVSGIATFPIIWTAPSTGSSTTFTLVGNATNNNNATSGDAWASLPFTFNVATQVITAPSISNVSSTNVTNNTANINATVNGNYANTLCNVEYGTTTSYGTNANPTPNNFSTINNVSATLSALAPNTLYHYRYKCMNSAGTTYSTDYTFTTLNTVSIPTISNVTSTSITQTGATINASIVANNAAASCSIEYGTTTAYGTTINTTPNSIATNGNVSAALSNLTPNTLYHYRVKSINTAGTALSADNIFTTISSSLLDIEKLGWNIYPNPTSNTFYISNELNNIQSVGIYHMNGQFCNHIYELNSPQIKVNINHLPKGIYHVVINKLALFTISKN